MTAPLPGHPYSGPDYHGSWSSPPAPGAHGAPGPYGYPMVAAAAPTNGFAIASMVLGIVWIYWIGSILAIVFGHLSLRQIKRNPYQSGRGMAIAGLVLGYVGLAVLALVVVGIAFAANSAPPVEQFGEVHYSNS